MSLTKILKESAFPPVSLVIRVLDGVIQRFTEEAGIPQLSKEQRNAPMYPMYNQSRGRIELKDKEGNPKSISTLIDEEYSFYYERFKDLIQILKKPSVVIFRLLILDGIDELRDNFGFHWTAEPSLLYNAGWRKSIGIEFHREWLKEGGLYVLCGEVPTSTINVGETLSARVRYPDEYEISLTGGVDAKRFDSLYVYRLGELDIKDIHNGNYLKKLK